MVVNRREVLTDLHSFVWNLQNVFENESPFIIQVFNGGDRAPVSSNQGRWIGVGRLLAQHDLELPLFPGLEAELVRYVEEKPVAEVPVRNDWITILLSPPEALRYIHEFAYLSVVEGVVTVIEVWPVGRVEGGSV